MTFLYWTGASQESVRVAGSVESERVTEEGERDPFVKGRGEENLWLCRAGGITAVRVAS